MVSDPPDVIDRVSVSLEVGVGRHSDQPGDAPRAEPARAAVSPVDVVVWGPFATVVAAGAARLNGTSWTATAWVVGLGAGSTGLLWSAARRSVPSPRSRSGRRRVQ